MPCQGQAFSVQTSPGHVFKEEEKRKKKKKEKEKIEERRKEGKKERKIQKERLGNVKTRCDKTSAGVGGHPPTWTK